MPLDQFLDLTPKEFWEALWEKEEHEKDLVIAQSRFVCETLRTQTAYLMNIQGARPRIVDPRKLMKFSWEKSRPAQTKEEMVAMAKAIAAGWSSRKN